MKPRLIVAALVRNEADRFWRSALEAWSQFADLIVVVDDGSTDGTAWITREFSARGEVRGIALDSDNGMWGKEASARAALWEQACYHANVGDYIFILDADMVPARDPRPLLASSPDAVAFTLYDLWSPNEYRCDGFWQGHTAHRVWLVRRGEEPEEGWKWNERGVHCGHLPSNLVGGRMVYAPADFSLLHHAYVSPALREQKHAQYMSVRDQLSPFELAHADSILAPATLTPLPFTPQYTLRLANEA